MGFGRKAAEKLDSAAAKLHDAGKAVAGEKGGRAGDAVANAVIAPMRNLCSDACTRSGCNHN